MLLLLRRPLVFGGVVGANKGLVYKGQIGCAGIAVNMCAAGCLAFQASANCLVSSLETEAERGWSLSEAM